MSTSEAQSSSDLLSKTTGEVSAIYRSQISTSGEVAEILKLVGDIDNAFQTLEQLYHGIHSDVKDVRQSQQSSEQQKMLEWLSSVDPSTNHNIAVRKREPKTGVWFLESDDFHSWMRSCGFLWLHGIPGCGKTVLCSTIIEAVKEVCLADATQKLAYFYFDFRDTEKQDVAVLLRSLIRQLCAGESDFPQVVETIYNRYKTPGHEPTVEELTSTLFSIIDGLRKEIYIIMDALDEYPANAAKSNRQELLDQIKRMIEHKSERLHILATSRNEHDIRLTLGTPAAGGISIQSSNVDVDIGMYIRTRLAEDPMLKLLPSNAKVNIEAKLGEGAHGMFRWAFCQLETLRSCRNRRAVQEALKALPRTLDETYERILMDIAKDDFDKEAAQLILQWLAFSERPLTLQEVAEAAILKPGDCPINLEERLFDPLVVLQICRGLVSLSREKVNIYGPETECDIVRIAHFSVKEYLMSDRSTSAFFISAESAHNHIGKCCISYLLQMDRPDLPMQCLNDYPLLQYSAEH
ncbi:MAG: hypothetical protein M1839_002525 [Geoglossum umbratile]|nr:MAG: hypothetical protein M1839_002525 [Geoglossum umbratile]